MQFGKSHAGCTLHTQGLQHWLQLRQLTQPQGPTSSVLQLHLLQTALLLRCHEEGVVWCNTVQLSCRRRTNC